MILENIDFLNEFNGVSVFVRLILALILGALLGIERERKQRPAGLRTYTLVCLGSALAAVTNEYICTIYPSADPARIPAQIVSGIGFLGAGTILVTVFSIVDKNFLKYNKYMNFYVEYNSKVFIRELIFYAKKSGYQILDLEITKDSSSGTYFATFQLKITNPSLRTLVLASVQELSDCIIAEEM